MVALPESRVRAIFFGWGEAFEAAEVAVQRSA
jgi:hypothetical protein